MHAALHWSFQYIAQCMSLVMCLLTAGSCIFIQTQEKIISILFAVGNGWCSVEQFVSWLNFILVFIGTDFVFNHKMHDLKLCKQPCMHANNVWLTNASVLITGAWINLNLLYCYITSWSSARDDSYNIDILYADWEYFVCNKTFD